MANAFNLLIVPINSLLLFLNNLTGNLGLAIILLTLIVRSLLFPLTLPSLRSAKKMQDLKPQLDKLKSKHTDKAKLQQAQLELYRQHGINPAAGCLPQILQLIVLIALYQVFIRFIGNGNGHSLNMRFLWLDLSKPDPYYILPVLAGLSQLVFSLMMRTGLESHVDAPKKKTDKQKEEDSLEMAQSMQQQMMYMMPIMTTVIALKFSSGLSLYWVVTTLFSVAQQYIISGPGGLKDITKILSYVKLRRN